MNGRRGISILLLPVALGAVGGCTARDGAARPAPMARGWRASALQTAEELAAKVRAAGVPCEGYAPADFEAVEAGSRGKVPVPAAMASCTSDDEEDLTFDVFEDAARAREYLEIKQAFLCRKAMAAGLADFPGFPVVDGGTWVIEPDEEETADRLAGILGGRAQQIPCKSE